MMMGWLVFVLCVGWVGVAEAQQQRVDFYDNRSNRTGYAIVDQKTGRVDVFDKYSNRKGYGQTAPSALPAQSPLGRSTPSAPSSASPRR